MVAEAPVEHVPLIQHYLDLAQPYLERYGYAAVFIGVMVEGFGVPAPGESLVIAGGFLAAEGKMSVLVLLVAWAAAVIGDNIGYAIGHFGGRRLVVRQGRRFGIRPEHLARVEAFFDRYGGGIVALARFFEVLRQLNGVVAGTTGMSWWRFLAFNALGATLWIGLWGAGAYFLGEHLDRVLGWFQQFEPYVIGAGILAFIILIVYLFRRRSNHSE
jgi:membrane protein DedA with SNARE-associated domain